jgi:hypothetical protein
VPSSYSTQEDQGHHHLGRALLHEVYEPASLCLRTVTVCPLDGHCCVYS